MEQYETVQRLGLGACGAVYLVRHVHTKRLFALKKIEIDERRKTKTQQAVLKEASILSGLRHPHIVLFHDSFLPEDQRHVCIIQDYCEGGTLADRIHEATNKNSPLAEKQIMQWFIQILMAVQYIHSKKVLHRDLKTENIFLTKNNTVKIGDFGISKILDNTIDVAKTVVGTPSYLSPELCEDIPYNSKSDIWALGCLLYEMCALRPPFDGNSLISLFFKIIKAEFQPVPSHYSEGVHEIINRVLVKTPEERPSASAILNLAFVKEHLSSFIQQRPYTNSAETLRKQWSLLLLFSSLSCVCGSASAILNLAFVKEHLSSFIQQTETLRKQRSANTSLIHKPQESSADSSLLTLSGTSPRTSHRRAGEATPRLKCSPVTHDLRPPQEADLTSVTKSAVAPDDCWLTEMVSQVESNFKVLVMTVIFLCFLQPALSLRLREAKARSQQEDAEANSEYSDDFDESSDSEIEEDIPGEKAVVSGATSEEEAQYADDFEDYNSDEELEEMLHQAREAQDLEPADDYFEDTALDSQEDMDDLGETLTESLIKSRLGPSGRGDGKGRVSSASACGLRPDAEKSEEGGSSWKFQTLPNS
ncbi:hypothetical protein ACOMHN_010748 [Nucella lapillus]